MNAGAQKIGLLTTLALLAAGSTMLGCKQPVLCPALPACGGQKDQNTGAPLPPWGEWVLAPGHPSCTEDLYVPANDTRLGLANLPPLGTPYPEPAVFDWCILLVTGPGVSPEILKKPPRFYYESGPIGSASIKYEMTEQGPHFVAAITRTGSFELDFPAYCVQQFGAKGGLPVDPTSETPTKTGDICEQLQKPIFDSGLGEGSYRNTRCSRNMNDDPSYYGCICTFDVTETGGPSGPFFMQNRKTITHLPGTSFPQKADFCQQGDSLQLTGSDDTYLFDQRGVRTFDLVRACAENSQCASNVCDTTVGVCSNSCTENSQCASRHCDTTAGICK